MLVGMDICLYVRVYVCMDICMWVCIYVWVYVCMYVGRYVGVLVGRKCMRAEICSYGGVFVRGGVCRYGLGCTGPFSLMCIQVCLCHGERWVCDNRDCPVIVTGCAARG